MSGRNWRRRLTLLGTACLLVGVTLAAAQTIAGQISGTVVDSSKGRLPGVTVAVINEGTQATRTVVTDAQGGWVITNLLPGTYTVEAELTGFKKTRRSGFVLNADGRLTADISLDVGGVTEVVEVISVAGESVNRTSGEIARTIDGTQVRDMALNGRNYLQLASIIPGAALLNDDSLDLTTSLSTTGQSINGSRGDSSSLLIDGGTNLDSGSNGSQINNVGLDFIQEVKMQTSNFSAEYGRQSGAAINVITRSGTNRLFGSAFEFFRHDGLDAANYFSPLDAAGKRIKQRLRFHDFGGALGGPLMKDKMFFFVGQEYKNIRRQLNPVQRSVPTTAELNGDFSLRLRGADLVVGTADDGFIRDPLRTGTCSAADRTACFPGNVIPSDRITADGKAIANTYRTMIPLAAAYNDAPVGNNATYQLDNPFDWRQDIVRLDYRFSPSQSVYLRYLHDMYDLIEPGGTFINAQLPTIPTNRLRPGYGYLAAHTWVLSPNVVNEVKVNASWNGQRIPPVGVNWRKDTYGLRVPGAVWWRLVARGDSERRRERFRDVPRPERRAALADNRYFHPGIGDVECEPALDQERVEVHTEPQRSERPDGLPRVRDLQSERQSKFDRLWSRGRAARKFPHVHGRVRGSDRTLPLQPIRGVRLRQLAHKAEPQPGARRAISVRPAHLHAGEQHRQLRSGAVRPGAGGQDESERHHRAELWLPLQRPHPRGGRDSWRPDRTRQSDHRRGLRSHSAGRGARSLRGGAPAHAASQLCVEPDVRRTDGRARRIRPFLRSAARQRGVFVPEPSALHTDQPVREWQSVESLGRNSGRAGAARDDQRHRSEHGDGPVHELQPQPAARAVGSGYFVEAAYVGNRGRNLLWFPEINNPTFDDLRANAALPSAQRASTNFLRPYKGYSSIRQRRSEGESNYNGLQLYATKRQGDFSFTVGYTLSKVLTNASGFGDDAEGMNLDYNYGPASYDRRHIFVSTYTYRVPLFKNSGGLLEATLGGWEVSGITRLQSGGYLTPQANTTIGGRRADYLGGEVAISDANEVKWFNTAAFGPAPEDRRGNAAVGIIQGPGRHTWDLSFRKKVRITGRAKVGVQADVFNLFNRVNLNNPSVNFNDTNYGRIASAGPPRQVQIGLRFEF